MTLPFDDLFVASASLDRGVLLSERTQLLAIKALQLTEFRSVWDETTDAEWDEVEALIGDAYAEILNEVSGGSGLTYDTFELRRTGTLAVTAALTAITWQAGSAFDSGNPTRMTMTNTGRAIISAHVGLTAGSGRGIYAYIRKNGSEIISQVHDPSGGLTPTASPTAQDDCVAGDYYELLVELSAANNTFQPSDNPQFFATVFSQ